MSSCRSNDYWNISTRDSSYLFSCFYLGTIFYRGFIMINNINELAEKGLRPCVLPQMSGGKWFWCVGVYIGNNTRAEWLRNHTEEGGPIGGYSDYYEALDAAIAYCNNYKPKIEHASKKVSKR